MKHLNHSGWFLMILGLAVAAAGIVLLFFLPGGCSYVTAAPVFSPAAPVRNTLTLLSDGLDLPWAAALRQQDLQVSSDRAESRAATLYAVSEGFFDFAHETLEEGRLLHGGDLLSGSNSVALINRKGADTLFPGISPVGQHLRLGETMLEIIGVTAGGQKAGEAQEILLFVPITLADTDLLSPQTLEIHTNVSGAETKAQFAASVRRLFPSGSLQDPDRLRLTALMPLWLLSCVLGFCVLKWSMKHLWHFSLARIHLIRSDLQEHYISRLLPKIAGRILVILILAALWIGAVFLLLKLIVLPIYTFTDWIPDSPFDPASVLETMKNLLTAAAASVVYKSRAAGTADLSASLIRAGSLIFLSGLLSNLFFRKRNT